MTLPVALTLGDPAGIGAEIALAAWRELRGRLAFFLIADPAHLREPAARLGVSLRAIAAPGEAAAVAAEALPVLPHPLPHAPVPGRPDAANAAATVAIIARGVELVRSGAALALCTNPINKKVLIDGAGFAFPGHTEFLAHLSGAALPVMMLAAPGLRVVPVTIHIPLAAVPQALTPALLEATLRITHRALTADFGIAEPRIAVAGLNPHAGEGGAMGREEIEVIGPVVARLAAEGMRLAGPRSADTMFHAGARARLRCRRLHVPRSGADPGQDRRLRARCQRDARPRLRAHLARPRHRLRHRRPRPRQPREPDRGAGARAGSRRHPRRGPAVSAAPDGLPPLRDVIAAHGLAARKALGQHFLLDLQPDRQDRPARPGTSPPPTSWRSDPGRAG